ncbi:MAG TPA: hypothetical protein VGN65_03965 [Casimicrobiaceae bacterium]
MTLREALAFYVRRDTEPASFYPVDASGDARKFDDLPGGLAGKVNTAEVPYDRKPGETPRLTDAELADLEAFLNTLTDGYRPPLRSPSEHTDENDQEIARPRPRGRTGGGGADGPRR